MFGLIAPCRIHRKPTHDAPRWQAGNAIPGLVADFSRSRSYRRPPIARENIVLGHSLNFVFSRLAQGLSNVDPLTAMVAIAHLRLRLTILERHPELIDMQIQRPMELAGLKSRLARAKKQESAIAEVGKRYDAVMDRIDELTGAGVDHVGSMEQYEADLRNTIEGMVAGGNGGPPLDGQTGQDQAVDIATAQQPAPQATVAPTPAQPSTEHNNRWP